MNMIYITCDIAVLEQVRFLIEKLNINSYQMIEEILGKAPLGIPHLNNDVWPGHNSIIMAQLQDDKTAELKKELQGFNQNVMNKNELITFACWSLAEYFSQ